MLTTIPFEDFMSIDSGDLTEAKEKFDIDKFENLSVYEMRDYLVKQCGFKVAGKGSSREVFFLNKANLSTVKGPACLKLIRLDGNKPIGAGIGQNREEINILKKFQFKHACFPWLYYYNKHNYFMIVELGTPLSDAPKGFVNEKFADLKEMIEDFVDENGYPSYSFSDVVDDILTNKDIKNGFTYFVSMLARIITKQTLNNYLKKDDAIWIDDFLNMIKNSSDPIVYSIYATLNFAVQKEAKSFMWGDFIQPENWAFVKRNGYFMLIPIDWGFTKKVARDFYGW